MGCGNGTVSFRSVRGIGSTKWLKIDGFYTAKRGYFFSGLSRDTSRNIEDI
jgi:hypothetical protein